MISFHIEPQVQQLRAGIVSANGLKIGPPGDELLAACAESVARVIRDGMRGGDARREAVRRLLRGGGFKPSGRNKPAHEYLLRTVTESGALPVIFNAVDWLNAISLESGLPISLLSATALGARATIRYGQPGERFVFNRSGQELELAGLICVCATVDQMSLPLGTPIKDSMAGKIGTSDPDVVAVIFAPQAEVPAAELLGWCDKLGEGFVRYCGAASFESTTRGCENAAGSTE